MKSLVRWFDRYWLYIIMAEMIVGLLLLGIGIGVAL
jgi:hypothetical protein